ncbi:MAG TPA: ComEA family DNA-binding protein [Jiangellaceae bacterium]|nr:ComEA family DNA-binding protein [Jiangellaceae bacterium]
MRFPLPIRRSAAVEQTLAARRRVASLARLPAVPATARRGWVPQVPPGLVFDAETSETTGDARIRTGPSSIASPGGTTSPGSGAGSAVLDRMPLRLRAVAEALPTVRAGRMALERGHAVVLVLVVLIGLAAAALLLGVGRPRVDPVDRIDPADAGVSVAVVATGTPASGVPDGSPVVASAAPGPTELVVHDAGRVRTPGVVRLPPGSRVLDAVEAAGGADDGVDLSGLNLARLLADGEQVLVGIAPAPGSVGTVGPPDGPATPRAGPIDLNSATADLLDTLPGVGSTLAGRILEWREQHGRFSSVDELLEVSGIGPKTLAELAPLVTV